MPDLVRLHNPALARKLVARVAARANLLAGRLGRRPFLMEVCGTHTAAISRSGIRSLLKETIELRSGPGCPVCVTAVQDLDAVIGLARLPGVTVATFGDLIRVPGSASSLEEERARGAGVRVIYSPTEAVDLARANPGEEVILTGVGFETTTPLVALAITKAKQRRLRNFSVLSLHKQVPPALRTLLSGPEPVADGLLLPGHVCAVTGRRVFDFIASKYGVPAVVTGFEPVDILGAVLILLDLLLRQEPVVVNGYTRVVREDGNPLARELIQACFDYDRALWRGLGPIPDSGLNLRHTYRNYDAALKFPLPTPPVRVREDCRCGDLLMGRIAPPQCPLFAHACTPVHPAGPCMVSTEGACSIYYQLERSC